ncbi:MAG: hypothetical protein ACRCZJ_00055 [Erysipelotrichaceae bacterium]
MRQFFNQNKLFASIAALVLCLNFLLGGILILQKTNAALPPIVEEPSTPDPSEPNVPEVPTTPNDPLSPEKTIEVVNFVGSFTDELNVRLTWVLETNDLPIESIGIYQNNVLLADVTNTNSYQLPLYAYGFATGSNAFELRVTPVEGEVISQTISVLIDYVFDVVSSYELTDTGANIIIEYVYGETTPVQAPSIYISDITGTNVAIENGTSEILESGTYVRARTVYPMRFDPLPTGIYNYNVTWTFANINKEIKYPMSIVIGDVSGLR